MGAIMLMCEEGMSSGYLPQEKLATGIEKKNHTIVKSGAVPGWGEATGSGAEGWAEEENWRSHKRQPPAASAHASLSSPSIPLSLRPSVPPLSLHHGACLRSQPAAGAADQPPPGPGGSHVSSHDPAPYKVTSEGAVGI